MSSTSSLNQSASAQSSEWRPLGPADSRGVVPRVTLPIPIGQHAAQTEKDIQEARARTAFDPTKIEEVLRDGRIDNSSRKEIIRVMLEDPIFVDWKKRLLVCFVIIFNRTH